MLEYFAYKKAKKHQAEKRARSEVQSPVLSEEDENFLERIVSAEGRPPALPERPLVLNPEAGDPRGNHSEMVVHGDSTRDVLRDGEHKHKEKGKEERDEKEKKKSNRFSFLKRSTKKTDGGLEPTTNVPAKEAEKEEDDINKVLDQLNLSAVNNRAFSISKESQVIVQKFTVILKDLVNGVPTAYDDLVNLIEDSQGTLAKSYDSMPSFLQKLITSLPKKFTSSLAPELLAVATEAQALGGVAGVAASGGFAGAAKKFLTPNSLKDLVTKPGAVVGMLKAIMNALKLRWPAFMGTNVLFSVALFVLLFVFWYCHKRGKEVRLEREGRERMVDSEGRVVELDDDPMLPTASAGSRTSATHRPDRLDAPPSRENRSRERPVSGSNRSRERRRHDENSRERHGHSERPVSGSNRSRERRGHDESSRERHRHSERPVSSSKRSGERYRDDETYERRR